MHYILILILILSSNIQSKGDPLFENNVMIKYKVNNSNNATNRWYNPMNYSEFYSYHILNQSFIEVNVINWEDPLSIINISIGNISRENISDNEAAEMLAFGYWTLPSQFGFIANTSWDLVAEDFNRINFNNSSFQSNLKYDYLGKNIDIVKFAFKDDIQETILIYEKENGLLLFARSTVFNFLLEIEIHSINNDESYFTKITEEKADWPLTSIVLGFCLIFAKIKNRNKIVK